MIDFGVDIKIEGSTSEQAIKRVTAELERNERAAKAAKEAVKQKMAEGAIAAGQEAEAVRKLTREFENSEKAIESTSSSLGQLNSAVRGVTQQLGEFGLAGNAVMGFASTLEHAGTAMMRLHIDTLMLGDGLVEMRNRLRAAGVASGDLSTMLDRVHQVADRSLTSIGSTIDAYARVKNATSELGFTQTRALTFTETLNKAFATSGRSTGEATAAMLQFSQALGSGVLQGDEFRSIAENAPFLLDAFAAKLHVTRGALKDLSSQGKITTDIMVSAIEGMAAKTDAAFAQMERTFSQRMQPVFNEIEADPFGFRKTATNAANNDPTAIFDLYKTINKGGPDLVPGLSTMANALGVDLPTTEVSEFNKQIGYMTDTVKQLAEAYGYQAKPELKSFDDQLADLVERSIPFTNHFKSVEDQLRNVGTAAKDAGDDLGTMLGTFKNFGQSIAVKVLPGLFDPWDHSLDDLAKHHTSTAKKMHDAWKDTYVSPTLVEIDMLIARMKLLVEAENEAANALRGMGISGEPAKLHVLRGLSGGSGSADDLAERSRRELEDQARMEREQRERRQRGEAFYQSLYGLNQTGERSGKLFQAETDRDGRLTEDGQQQAALYTKRWTEELEKNKKAWEDVDKFGQQTMGHIEDAMVQLVESGKFSFRSLVDSILADLTRLATHRLLMSLINGIAGGGGTASVFGTGATQAFQGLYGGGHATGGVYRAPLTGGGPDSIPVLFHMSPGETASFTPQGQQQPGGSVRAKVVYNEDRRALLDMLDTPEGVAVLAEVHRKNPHLTRRR